MHQILERCECIDSMIGQMRAVVLEEDPTLAFYNEHIQPIIQHRWDNLNTPLSIGCLCIEFEVVDA